MYCNIVKWKHAQKWSFMPNLMKRQIVGYEATFLLIILDNFCLQNQIQWKKLSGKTHSYYCFYVWFKNKRVRTSLDGKNRNLTKKKIYEKILEFFSKTFCLSDLYCQTNFWNQNLKQRPIKKRPPLKAALDLQFFIQICQRFLKLLRLS